MKIQLLARFSELSVKPNNINKEEAELKRIIDGEEDSGMHFLKTEIIHEYAPMTVDIKRITEFNRSKESGHTTIHFKDGNSWVFKISYFEFLEIYVQYTGEQVLDFLPKDYVDPEEQDIENENEEDLEL
jgi:hypothetical protein